MEEAGIQINKCPNCSGKMEPSYDRNVMVCPYCGSEFTMHESVKKAMENAPVNKDWFVYEWDYKMLTGNAKMNPTVTSFVRTLNDYETSAQVIDYMRTYLMGYGEISAPGLREEKMRGILPRISSRLDPDEKVILYDDNGLFVHGKTGTVITTKRTFLIEKKTVKEIMHVAVPYLFFEYSLGLPGIKLGEQYANSIGIFNSHFDLQGTAAALICFLSFEINRSRPKIKLTS